MVAVLRSVTQSLDSFGLVEVSLLRNLFARSTRCGGDVRYQSEPVWCFPLAGEPPSCQVASSTARFSPWAELSIKELQCAQGNVQFI